MWLILGFMPGLLDITLPVFLAFAPDLGLVLLFCGAAVALTAVARVVVYIAFTRRANLVSTGQS